MKPLLAIGLGAEAKGNGSIAIGPGAKAGVTEVYQGLKPTVAKVDLNSMNVATNGAYESELWLTINDPPRGGINVKCGSPAGCLSLNCSAYFIQSVLQAGHGTFNEGHCRVSVVTKEKVGGQSDFLFDIEAVQNPRK